MICRQSSSSTNKASRVLVSPSLVPPGRRFAFFSEHQEASRDIQLEVAGDGAIKSRTSSFQLLNVSLLNSGRHVLQRAGVRTVAVFPASEDYEDLRDGFQEVWAEINDLIDRKEIHVDCKSVAVETLLAGEMKFQQKVIGLQGATSTYACTRCKVAKNERWNMGKADDLYTTAPMARTVEELHNGKF